MGILKLVGNCKWKAEQHPHVRSRVHLTGKEIDWPSSGHTQEGELCGFRESQFQLRTILSPVWSILHFNQGETFQIRTLL